MDFSKITIADYLIVIATVMGPILAVQAQKRVEVWNEKRNRKLRIFYNLMATRGARISERHVEALNSIQLEYSSLFLACSSFSLFYCGCTSFFKLPFFYWLSKEF